MLIYLSLLELSKVSEVNTLLYDLHSEVMGCI